MNNSNTDSVTQVNTINIGVAAPLAMDLTYVAMSKSVGQLMNNAVTTENYSQIIQNTTVAQCCALIISLGAAGAAKK